MPALHLQMITADPGGAPTSQSEEDGLWCPRFLPSHMDRWGQINQALEEVFGAWSVG